MTPTAVRNQWLMLLSICLGFFMIMLDTTIVYVATPSILSGLHASLDEVLWVFNGYLLAFAVLLITAGRLGDVFGPRNLFVAGLGLFTVASAACGFSHDSTQLITARVLQGVGGALLAPQSLTILTRAFPAERRGAVLGIWSAVIGLSTLAGPTLGGLIVTYADWRWIFFVNVPVGIVSIAAALTFVPNLRPGARQGFDLAGVALASVGLFLVVFALIEGQRYHWAGWIWGLAAAGLGVLAVFVLWETRQSEPLIPLGLFRDRNFSLMNWTGLAMGFAMQGIFIPFTIYTQTVLGMSPLRSGLTAAPLSLASGVVAPFAGRLADRVGGKYLMMTGLVVFGSGAAWFGLIAGPVSSSTDLILPLLVAGAGLGAIFAPMTTVAMERVTGARAGAASGILNTTRQLGSVFGAAVVGAVIQNRLAAELNDRAVTASLQLPAAVRTGFLEAFARAAREGADLGRGQGGAQLPSGIPAPVAQLVQHLAHDVFVNSFIAAMRPSILLASGVLLAAAVSCLLVQRRRSEPVGEAAVEPVEQLAA